MDKKDLNRLPLNRGANSHKKGLATGQMTQQDQDAVLKKVQSVKDQKPVAK